MIYGNVPVTREELGEFLIARGGYEKVELLVNKKIIEIEAARRNVTVTEIEVRKPGSKKTSTAWASRKEDFIKHILPRYGKTLYEWTEDVIKPRLLLTKMCRDRVKVTEDDLKRLVREQVRRAAAGEGHLLEQGRPEDRPEAVGRGPQGRRGVRRHRPQQADPNLASSCRAASLPVGKNAYDDTEGEGSHGREGAVQPEGGRDQPAVPDSRPGSCA